MRREGYPSDWVGAIQGLGHLAMIGTERSKHVKWYGGLEEHAIQFTTTSRTYPSTSAVVADQLRVLSVSQMAVDVEVRRGELSKLFGRLRANRGPKYWVLGRPHQLHGEQGGKAFHPPDTFPYLSIWGLPTIVCRQNPPIVINQP